MAIASVGESAQDSECADNASQPAGPLEVSLMQTQSQLLPPREVSEVTLEGVDTSAAAVAAHGSTGIQRMLGGCQWTQWKAPSAANG